MSIWTTSSTTSKWCVHAQIPTKVGLAKVNQFWWDLRSQGFPLFTNCIFGDWTKKNHWHLFTLASRISQSRTLLKLWKSWTTVFTVTAFIQQPYSPNWCQCLLCRWTKRASCNRRGWNLARSSAAHLAKFWLVVAKVNSGKFTWCHWKIMRRGLCAEDPRIFYRETTFFSQSCVYLCSIDFFFLAISKKFTRLLTKLNCKFWFS